MKIFLTGRPRVGKSTVLQRIIEALKENGLKIGGFVTPEIKKNGRRFGFAIKDVYSEEEGTFAKKDLLGGKKFGTYGLDMIEFERIALKALDFAFRNCDVIAIDEIGTMELFSEKFKTKLIEILVTDKKVLAVLHRSYCDEFRKFGRIIEITEKNRDRLVDEIVNEILKKD